MNRIPSQILRSRSFLESKKQIKDSYILKDLMSTNDLRTVVQNTNDITKANSSIDLRISSNYTIEPINPKIVYREKMRLLRNKYAEESAIIKLSNANKKAEEEKAAIKERELFDIDVEKRKKERRLMESDITFDSELVDTSLQVDPVIKQKQEQWNTWVEERNQTQFDNKLISLKEKSDQRLEDLVFLFQSASTFLTHTNMEDKIEKAFMTSVEYNRDMNKDINLAIKNKDVNKLNKRMNALDAYMNIGDGPLVGVGAKELVETAQDRNAPEDMLESVNAYEKKQTEMKRKLQEKMFNKN